MAKAEKLVSSFKEHLGTNEEILIIDAIPMVVIGQYEITRLGQDALRTGSLIATNQRLAFFAKKLSGYEIESFPYKSISSIEQSKGMMGGQVKIVASGNTASVKWIADIKMLSTLVEAVRTNINNLSSDTQSPSETSPNIIDQIKQLAQLHEAGILTDEEFNLKKKSLLDKI